MALTKAQIQFLRHASQFTVYGFNNSPHPDLPFRGAPAMVVIKSLRTKGWINLEGYITEAGKSALLTDPQASSEAP